MYFFAELWSILYIFHYALILNTALKYLNLVWYILHRQRTHIILGSEDSSVICHHILYCVILVNPFQLDGWWWKWIQFVSWKTKTLSERKPFLYTNEHILIIQVIIPDRQGKFLYLEFSRGAICTTQIYLTFSLTLAA